MSYRHRISIGSPILKSTQLKLTNYNGSHISTLREFSTGLAHEKRYFLVNLIMVNSQNEYGLHGRDAIDSESLKINTFAIETEFLPVINCLRASIKLVGPDKCLKFFRARPVAIHCKSQSDAELPCLKKQRVIAPIEETTHTSPMLSFNLFVSRKELTYSLKC